METQEAIDYKRIEKAIGFMKAHYQAQPSLEEIAAQVHLSAFHFQRMFKEWAGITPKEFIQFLSIEHAKALLKAPGHTLFDAAYQAGLSGTGRLHDLFVKVEGMSPGEFKNGGAALNINYSFAGTPFGEVLVASTGKGICYMAFADDLHETALGHLKAQFPKATYHQLTDEMQQKALIIFNQDWQAPEKIKLHLKGTAFQLKVWQALLKIPVGALSSYTTIANAIEHPKASRAVGSAVGDNPVAFIIPCHRVILANGITGQYHWGAQRKSALIGWEGRFGAGNKQPVRNKYD